MARAVASRRGVDVHLSGRMPDAIYQWFDTVVGVGKVDVLRSPSSIDVPEVELARYARLSDRGVEVTGVWGVETMSRASRMSMAEERPIGHSFGIVPMDAWVIDQRHVILDGPQIRGRWSIMMVTDPNCVSAAIAYRDTVTASAYPCAAECASLTALTPRQHRIAALLMSTSKDTEIAETLGLGLRTVSAEIAAILDLCGAPNRFAAGARLIEMLGQPPSCPDDLEKLA